MSDDLTGTTIGPWLLQRVLGRSPSAETYLARDEADLADPSLYVIKIASNVGPAFRRAMLLREATILNLVEHPNVVSVLDHGQDRVGDYLVLPFVNGVLRPESRTRPVRRQQWGRLAWVARQVVAGLRSIHRHGFVHGDLKPSNIAVDASMHVTLIDLGLAESISLDRGLRISPGIEQGGGTSVTSPGRNCLKGSPPYMAPEMFIDGEAVSTAQDVYALGCMLYHWFVGARPFYARGLEEWKQKHLSVRPVPPAERNIDIPSSISQLITAMLSKHPVRRPCLEEVERALVDFEVSTLGSWLVDEQADENAAAA